MSDASCRLSYARRYFYGNNTTRRQFPSGWNLQDCRYVPWLLILFYHFFFARNFFSLRLPVNFFFIFFLNYVSRDIYTLFLTKLFNKKNVIKCKRKYVINFLYMEGWKLVGYAMSINSEERVWKTKGNIVCKIAANFWNISLYYLFITKIFYWNN